MNKSNMFLLVLLMASSVSLIFSLPHPPYRSSNGNVPIEGESNPNRERQPLANVTQSLHSAVDPLYRPPAPITSGFRETEGNAMCRGVIASLSGIPNRDLVLDPRRLPIGLVGAPTDPVRRLSFE